MSDQYDEYDGYDRYEGYEDYDYYEDDFRPDGTPGPMMPSQGQPPFGPSQGQPPFGPPQGQPPFGPPQGQPPFGPPQGQPPFGPPQGQPPFGPPQGQPGLLPYSPGPHNFGQFAPNMRPPSFIPRRPGFLPGPVRQCRNRFAYIWLNNGRNFWAWISSVTPRVVYGYRWDGRRWVYFEVFTFNIVTFVCIR